MNIEPVSLPFLSSGAGRRPPVLTNELLAVGAVVVVDLGAVGEERDHAAATDATVGKIKVLETESNEEYWCHHTQSMRAGGTRAKPRGRSPS